MTDILLIQPPALKPSEPPLSLAVLTAAIKAQGLAVITLDANLQAYQFLLDGRRLADRAGDHPATSIQRALKHRQAAIALLGSPRAGQSLARYATAVGYLNQLLGLWSGDPAGERLSLGDYQSQTLSPFAPADLQALADGQARTLFREYFQEQLLPQIEPLRPRLISLSINYVHQALPAFELAGLLRRSFPAAILVAGGGLVTSWQEPLRRLNLQLPPFDRLIFGPGEALLPALLKGGLGADYYLADASGIGFLPDFAFAPLGDYLSPQPVLPLSASRGCYWRNCLFCPEATAPVHPYAASGSAAFVELLSRLSRTYGVDYFHLTDNAIPVSILKELAARHADLERLSWFGFVRFEKALEDADFVRQLAKSGCRMLQLGLESGSQQVLDRLGKGIRLESVGKILANLHAAGIASYVYIMLGTPGEEEADAELTRSFLEEHAARIGFLNLAIMNLPRGSGLLDNPGNYGIAASQLQNAEESLGLYHNFQPTSGWDRAAARRFLERRLLGSPAIRAIVKRTPPLFSSNHAVFFAREDLSAGRLT
jgi:hypothetical protein